MAPRSVAIANNASLIWKRVWASIVIAPVPVLGGSGGLQAGLLLPAPSVHGGAGAFLVGVAVGDGGVVVAVLVTVGVGVLLGVGVAVDGVVGVGVAQLLLH